MGSVILVSRHRTRLGGTLDQLPLGLDPVAERWRFTRPAARSRYRARILARLEAVRRFFPELDGVAIRVGLARSPRVLGRCSLDPADPAIWVRPRLVDAFTVAHELTHLLQVRGLVPGGERACDLHALARSPHLVDAPPTYLEIPEALRTARRLDAPSALLLHRAARDALAARAAGRRDYLKRFERAVADGWGQREVAGGSAVGAR